MKSKYLDTRNCHALLPTGHGLQNIQRLEECLHGINNKHEKHQGLIDKLIEHNNKTINKLCGSRRFFNSHFQIAQGLKTSER